MTGCLQIAKESIFTGLNNFSVRSILNQYSSNCFGFEQDEIDELLKYYGLYDKKDYIKQWYDGYCFYDKEIYNPWSTLLYVKELLEIEILLLYHFGLIPAVMILCINISLKEIKN